MTPTAMTPLLSTTPSSALSAGSRSAARLRTVALAACALLLQACGGGGGYSDSGTSVSTTATVSAAAANRLSYGRLSTFTVTGTYLTTGVSFSATGCDGLTVLAGGSATQQTVTCTPNKALSVRLAVNAGGTEVYSSTQAVPKPRVTLVTSLGSIVVELEPASTPVTVDNFLAYVSAGFYSSTIFHRVIAGFVVQGGGFTSAGAVPAGLRAAIALESNKGLSNLRGTIAMARQDDPAFNSATSQFYFNSANNTFLDYASTTSPGYAVFGRVVGATDLATIDAISARPTNPATDKPTTDIVLQSATQTL